MDVFGYREGREMINAKIFIDGGKNQLKYAVELNEHAKRHEKIYEMCGLIYPDFEKEQEIVHNKKTIAIEKIVQGLEIYKQLLTSENIEHFDKIKAAIKKTISNYNDVLSDEVVERYTNCPYVGAE